MAQACPQCAMPRAGLCSSHVLPLLLAYICYLLLGATVFWLLEKPAEAESRDQFQLEKLHFLGNYTCLDRWALEQFLQVREAAGGQGGQSCDPRLRTCGSRVWGQSREAQSWVPPRSGLGHGETLSQSPSLADPMSYL